MAVVERGFLHETLISAVILTVISATHPRPHGFLRRPRRTALAAPLVTKPSSLPSAHSAHPIPATQSSPSAQPDKPPQSSPSTTKPTPTRNAHARHFDHNCRLLIDGKPI